MTFWTISVKLEIGSLGSMSTVPWKRHSIAAGAGAVLTVPDPYLFLCAGLIFPSEGGGAAGRVGILHGSQQVAIGFADAGFDTLAGVFAVLLGFLFAVLIEVERVHFLDHRLPGKNASHLIEQRLRGVGIRSEEEQAVLVFVLRYLRGLHSSLMFEARATSNARGKQSSIVDRADTTYWPTC